MQVNIQTPAANIASLLGARYKPKPQANTLPWVGSYFGIPQPEDFKPFKGQTGSELEIHILKSDLTVRNMVLRFTDREGMFLYSDILNQLQNMAYIDDAAIAFKVYHFCIDAETGEREEVNRHPPCARVGKERWCRLSLKDNNYVPREEFTPSIYNTLSSYRDLK